ncbi:hypothetical protein AVT69_gp250 [Pseudomonas phage PhiPA3]|uniref:Uncharacterized protein 252 n=1 Tax=Pseudomonas phage PhiPA3 TaxID=998086 RepID=F8SJ93_BPPA3|nr:hypothetical protein AVT69_gp250 [Pseudomonas phage PhiPA3]AEH03675.1 hypothetical protein [Pseudomonas phage PhiPA3]
MNKSKIPVVVPDFALDAPKPAAWHSPVVFRQGQSMGKSTDGDQVFNDYLNHVYMPAYHDLINGRLNGGLKHGELFVLQHGLNVGSGRHNPNKTNLYAERLMAERFAQQNKLRELEGSPIPEVRKNPVTAAVQMVVQGRLSALRDWFETKHEMWITWINGLVASGLVHRTNEGNSIYWYDIEGNMSELLDPNKVYC